MASGSTKAVYTAIAGNSLVMVAKFVGFAMTGSGALLSEGIHSLADVGNQSLLALGIKQSELPPDEDHPYGYGGEQFVWSLISAVGIFFLGCGVTAYHGVHTLLHPEPIESPGVALGILAFAVVVEGYALGVATVAIRKQAAKAGVPFWTYVREGPDPMAVAVLLEDSAAVFGVLLAAGSIGLGQLTGSLYFDGIASLLIAALLGGVAIFLVRKNRSQLLGKAVRPEVRERLVHVIADDPVVHGVLDVKATRIGADAVRFKAEVEFDGRAIARRHLSELGDLHAVYDGLANADDLAELLVSYANRITDALGDEVDRLEAKVRSEVPEARHVDLEAD